MELNKYIDYTNLKMFATKKDIEQLCDEAIKYSFEAVCVNPYYVSLVNELLIRSNVKVCTVIGFPLGQNTKEVKLYETKIAIESGADEVDMVINVGALKDGYYDYVKDEIKAIRELAKDRVLKVIIETCCLNNDEIILMTNMCNELGVDFIKTSTGFGIGGAKIEDIELINKYKNDKLQIKASGGIKSYDQALEFINRGATRIGTSNGIKIMEGDRNEII